MVVFETLGSMMLPIKLYDRTNDAVSLDEVERVVF
jgi:hypothetical protein